MNRKLIYLVLVCFCLSILGLAFHHHEDGTSHDDCSICSYVSHQSNVVFLDLPQISPPTFYSTLIPLENTVILSFLCCSPHPSRAPPA